MNEKETQKEDKRRSVRTTFRLEIVRQGHNRSSACHKNAYKKVRSPANLLPKVNLALSGLSSSPFSHLALVEKHTRMSGCFCFRCIETQDLAMVERTFSLSPFLSVRLLGIPFKKTRLGSLKEPQASMFFFNEGLASY